MAFLLLIYSCIIEPEWIKVNEGDYRDALKVLSSQAPTFASPGNHDGGEWVFPLGGYPTTDAVQGLLESSGIHFLQNQCADLEIHGHRMRIAGLGDMWSGFFKPGLIEDALAHVPPPLTIVLSHNPENLAYTDRLHWDVMLSGHTHGGQVSLPIIRPPILPVKDRRYIEGLYRLGNRFLYVSKGVGTILRIRFNCRPEITVLTIRY
jgi:predicted MPP superfamily phosphohydrolase